MCNPAGGNDTSLCDSILDWSLSYDGDEEAIYTVEALNGMLYAGKEQAQVMEKCWCATRTEPAPAVRSVMTKASGLFRFQVPPKLLWETLKPSMRSKSLVRNSMPGLGQTPATAIFIPVIRPQAGTSLSVKRQIGGFWDSASEEVAWDFATLNSKVYASFGYCGGRWRCAHL